jgi:hypothetical protein
MEKMSEDLISDSFFDVYAAPVTDYGRLRRPMLGAILACIVTCVTAWFIYYQSIKASARKASAHKASAHKGSRVTPTEREERLVLKYETENFTEVLNRA